MALTKLSKIPLSKGKAFALVDECDVALVSQYTWSLHSDGYAVRNRAGQTIYMHSLILGVKHVDHKNGVASDNRRCNLRPSDHRRNAQNSKPHGDRRFKGVTLDKSRGKWIARIQVDGKPVNIGRFVSEEEAARAYDDVAIKLCETPYLNFGGGYGAH
jgi:hypothetical protein